MNTKTSLNEIARKSLPLTWLPDGPYPSDMRGEYLVVYIDNKDMRDATEQDIETRLRKVAQVAHKTIKARFDNVVGNIGAASFPDGLFVPCYNHDALELRFAGYGTGGTDTGGFGTALENGISWIIN